MKKVKKVMDFVSAMFYHTLFALIVISAIGYLVSLNLYSEFNAELFSSYFAYSSGVAIIWAMVDYLGMKMAESRKRFHS